MIYTKQALSPEGKFAKKGEDIKNGDIVEIVDEGNKVQGKYGEQDVFKIKTVQGEFLININGTSINNMIDAYGPDSKDWVGKKVKIWLIQDFKDGKLIWKMYLTHPEQILGQSMADVNKQLQQENNIDDIPEMETDEPPTEN